jgi:hypothetical protein
VGESALREGDAVSVTGQIDANGILNAQTIVPVAPAPRLPRWLWLALPGILLAAQWFVEDAASGGSSVWDQTWEWARNRFTTWPPSESWFRGTEDEWIFFLIAGLGVFAAAKLIRRPHPRVLVRTAGLTFAMTAIGCWLAAWDVLMVARLALMSVTAACIGYAVYVSPAERRSILLEPPRWPSLWWLALPAVGCVGSWLVVVLLIGNFGVPLIVLLAGGIAVFYAAAKQIRSPSIRVVVEAVAAAVAVVGLDGTLRLGVPVFALLFSLAVTCAIAAICLAVIRVVRKSPTSAPA